MVMEVVHEEMGDGNMVCTNHPYKNSTPGGICAFCLQEKLGKLVSSSFPVAVFPSSSSSSTSPSFRSDIVGGIGGVGGGSAVQPRRQGSSSSSGRRQMRKTKLPFILIHRKKKKVEEENGNSNSVLVFKRSKSTATPRAAMDFLDENYAEDFSPNRRRFWSFLQMHKCSSNGKKSDKPDQNPSSNRSKRAEMVVVDENGTPDEDPVPHRKVSRSRSVGCGSRSFSGDFFERISTGFGDCTLRRVESQREGKSKTHSNGVVTNGQDCIKERVKCGGIFRGFMITASSSSSSSSSYWVSSSSNNSHINKSRGWGWALGSPMRGFGKKGSNSNSNKSTASPNLASIPSLLEVSSG